MFLYKVLDYIINQNSFLRNRHNFQRDERERERYSILKPAGLDGFGFSWKKRTLSQDFVFISDHIQRKRVEERKEKE